MARGRRIIPVLIAASLVVFSDAAGQDRGRRRSGETKLQAGAELDRVTAARLINRKQYSEAIELLRPLCEEHVDRHDLTELLARCYLRAGRPADAVSLLEDRIGRAPGRMVFVGYLAEAYLDTGEKEKALATWEKALEEGERYPERFGNIARMQWLAGMHDLSLETLKRGSVFPGYFENSYREIIRIERVLGRSRDAFLSAVELFAGTTEPMQRQPRILLETYRDAGRDPDLLAGVDSLAATDSPNGRYFQIAAALLRAQGGDFAPALRMVSGLDGREATAREIYYFAAVLLEMDEYRREPGYQRLYDEILAVFSGRFARSSIVPQMLLSAANFNMENGDDAAAEGGGRGGDEATRYYEMALSLADSARSHPAARVLTEQADLLRARLLVERLYRPEDAMDILAGRVWNGRGKALEAASLRLEASLATARWDETESWLKSLEASGDTVFVAFGTYGRGMMELYRGRYSDATGLLSSMAEEYPGSEWANDALSWAMAAKMATTGEDRATGIYVAAMSRGARGDFDGAVASLDRMTAEHPESALLPRAMWERSRILELCGKATEALETLSALVDRYPEDVYAPRALEKLGDMVSGTGAEAGAAVYERLLEEYQGYPFISRVRAKYVELQAGGKQFRPEDAGS